MKKNLKILFLCDYFPAISETFVQGQVDFFDLQEDIEVDVFALALLVKNQLSDKYENQIGFKSNLIKLVLFPVFFLKFLFLSPKLLFRSLNFFKYGREALYLKLFYSLVFFYNKKYDAIVAHYGRSGNVGSFMKENWMLNTKLLCVFHGRDIREGVEFKGKIYSELFKNVDKILSISSYNTSYLKQWGARNIVHHPNGIDLSYFKKKNFRKSNEEIIILSVGRLVWEKGYFYAIDGIKKLIVNNPKIKIRYYIVGAGTLEKSIRDYISLKGLEKVVIMQGERLREDILNFYQNADIYLLSSVAEALPVVLLEAAACELPIVATNVGSVYEQVEDRVSGFLIPSKSSDEIYEKLDVLVKDEKKRREFGIKGRQIVSEKYDIKKLNEKLLGFIE